MGWAMSVRRTKKTRPSLKVDTVFHPWVLTIAKHIAAGGKYGELRYRNTDWSEEEARSIHTSVDKWLRTRDFMELATLLQAHMAAIAHPLVHLQLLRLRSTLRQVDEDDVKRDPTLAQGSEVLPAGTVSTATRVLQVLFAGLWKGMAPGWSVEFKRNKQRGTGNRWPDELIHRLKDDESVLCSMMESIEDEERYEPRRRKNESAEQYMERMADLVEKLDEAETCFSIHHSPWLDRVEGDVVRRTSPHRFPRDVARIIACNALNRRHVVKRRLIYGLLAFYQLGGPQNHQRVRGLLERSG